jgi:hypothetical protein
MTKKVPLRRRIQPYILRELAHRLAKYAVTHGTTDSAVVEAALRQLLDGTNDHVQLLRSLDRNARALERLQRDLELSMETFAIWVRFWFAHTPPIAEDAKRAARALVDGRYRQFANHVADQFNQGKRFIDDLPQESIADDDELVRAAEQEPERDKKK